jgi:hypothetical protein
MCICCCGKTRVPMCSRRNTCYRRVYGNVCLCRCCQWLPRCCRRRCALCESARRPNPWRMRWYETICPCVRDKFAPARGSHDVCCCRLQTMVVVAAWCLVASSLLIGGLFFFFSSIFEFAKHLYVKSEEAMVLGIALFLVGFYTASRTVRAALYVGLDRDMELAWAPIYCPGYVCHMCCTSKKERVRFVKEKCGCGCHRCTETCVFCCCNSDPHAKPVQFNQIFNEDEIEYGLRLAESSYKMYERF